MWMAGGGAKGGTIYGETDDFSYNIVKDPVHIRDFHATVLHLLGSTTTPPRRRGRPWWHLVALGLVLLVAAGVVVAVVFPERFVGGWHEWQLRRLRNDILSGKLSTEALRDELVRRDDGLYYAVRLSEDPDPRVRAAAIDRFVAGTAPAQKQPGDNRGGMESWSEESLKRLLEDPNSDVRQKAIHAASGIALASRFEEQLLPILESGPVAERLIVCEYLAHWHGAAVRWTFGNPKQPKEVRLAALRSAERYGWAKVVTPEPDFVRTMRQVAAERDPDLRRAAQDALTRAASEK
jgi:hypothetical protein